MTKNTLGYFFRINQYIGDTNNTRTLIPMNTRAQTLPRPYEHLQRLGLNRQILKIDEVTTSASLSRQSCNSARGWALAKGGAEEQDDGAPSGQSCGLRWRARKALQVSAASHGAARRVKRTGGNRPGNRGNRSYRFRFRSIPNRSKI
jgi:hypothetical protein